MKKLTEAQQIHKNRQDEYAAVLSNKNTPACVRDFIGKMHDAEPAATQAALATLNRLFKPAKAKEPAANA